MANHLGPFLGASDQPEGQELGGGAEGGQEVLQASEYARDMVLVTKPMFWDMGNHLGPFSEASDRPGGQELGGEAEGGQEVLQGVKF